MRIRVLFFVFLALSSFYMIQGQETLTDKTLIWNTSSWGNGFGHKIYSYDPGGRTDLRIASRNNSTSWSDMLTLTSWNLIGINSNSPNATLHITNPLGIGPVPILYGENPLAMGTETNSYSPNLFLLQTKLDAFLGLHAYVYRKAASTSWTGGTVRLSSAADGILYSQDNKYNNLNWIDFIGYSEGIEFGFGTNSPTMSIKNNLVVIGNSSSSNYLLNVRGKIRADEIVVNTTGADFVFEPNYKLRSLSELEIFIRTNKHLPDIAPAKEMQQNGVSAGEMQAKLLQKVEELTLYVIEKDKEIAALKQMVTDFKKELEQLKK